VADFGHDTEHALGVVVALVNTDPATSGGEGLADVAALRRLVAAEHVSDVGPLTEEDLAAARRLRARFLAVWRATTDEEAVALVNALVADARTTPRLTDHDGWPLHMHYFAPGSGLAEHLAADGGMALALVLAAGERARLRTCAAPGCGNVLVDLSRNRSRRYCDSRTCGNRLHVAAYRARRRVG
jgi:predicted RNA-binding Zn ribbon-like protein